MATTLQRIKQSEIRRPGPTVSRSLVLGYMESLEELFCVATKSLPQELRGQGDYTSLAKIREKQDAPIIARQKAKIEREQKEQEEMISEVRKSEYCRQADVLDFKSEGLDYGNVDEELVMDRYVEFAAKLVDLGVLSAADCEL